MSTTLIYRALFVAGLVLAQAPSLFAQTETPTPTATATGTPTPTRTVTITPTPTVTQTPVGRHYQCYEVNRKPFTQFENVQVTDALFGSSLVDVRQAKRLCNPADKNDEDPTAPNETEHLVGYNIRQVSPRFLKFPNIFIINQFGVVTVDAARPRFLLVPSTKEIGVVPPPQGPPTIDHYKCYNLARTARTNLENIKVDDQFGTIFEDLKRPAHLCMPADKNGEGIPAPAEFLVCYTAKANRDPRFIAPGPIFIDNQFNDSAFIGITRPTELCVPSIVRPACCGPNDRCIDADGTLTPGDGIPSSVQVVPGNLLTTFPVVAPNGSGLALFDNNGNQVFNFGFTGDDLAAQGSAACPTGMLNGVFDAGADCPVLDLNGSLTNGQTIDCNLETGAGCTPPLPAPITYFDANNNGSWDNGEDIVLDVNGNFVCD